MSTYENLFKEDQVTTGVQEANLPTIDAKKKTIQGWINTNSIPMDQDPNDNDADSINTAGSTASGQTSSRSNTTVTSQKTTSTEGTRKRRRTSSESNKTQGNNSNASSKKENTIPTIPQPKNKSIKIPPINAHFDPTNVDKKHNWTTLYSEVRLACQFLPIFNGLSKSTCAIYPVNLADFRAIQAKLTELKFEFFLYKTESPPVKYLIKGLRIFLDSNSLQRELTEQGFDVVAVNYLRSFKTKEQTTKLIVTLKSDSEKTRSILELKSIFCIRIKVEKFKKPPIATQCYNCQGFHHVAKLCHALPKCVKCGQNHNTSDCQRMAIPEQPESEKEPIKCVNCGGEHTANYRGCPVFKKLNDRIKSKIIANNRPTQSNVFKVLERDFPEIKSNKNKHTYDYHKTLNFENKSNPKANSATNTNTNVNIKKGL